MTSPLDSNRFAGRVGAWISEEGPDADVVISCRARLARNVSGFPFVPKLSPESAQELSGQLRALLEAQRIDGETHWVGMEEASAVLRLLLRERHLVSREMAPSDPRRPVPRGRAVAFGDSERLSVMINEEDHLRLQGFASGFDLGTALERVRSLDITLEGEVDFVHTERLGYLTGCPTNVGTGLRASVMLHLPALGMVRSELEKVFGAAQRTGLAVRGMYGEGSRAAGDYYQISNQVTLGRSEDELVHVLQALVPRVVEFERRLRGALFAKHDDVLRARVFRSLGQLKASLAMPTEQALTHLSNLRLGVCQGLVDEGPLARDLDPVAIQVQRGHIQALEAESEDASLLDVSERDRLRAAFLRRQFG